MKPPSLRTPSQRAAEQRRLFRPYANELGWLVYQWNRLQQAMAELFTDLVTPDKPGLGLAVWHAVISDRSQREMLLAAVKKSPLPSKTADDLTWLLKECLALLDKRNDALHSPLIFVTDTNKIDIMPFYFMGNPRARKLMDKNLLDEFAWYRDSATTLSWFAEQAHYSLQFPEHFPWPERPLLPRLGQSRSRKTKRPRKAAK